MPVMRDVPPRPPMPSLPSGRRFTIAVVSAYAAAIAGIVLIGAWPGLVLSGWWPGGVLLCAAYAPLMIVMAVYGVRWWREDHRVSTQAVPPRTPHMVRSSAPGSCARLIDEVISQGNTPLSGRVAFQRLRGELLALTLLDEGEMVLAETLEYAWERADQVADELRPLVLEAVAEIVAAQHRRESMSLRRRRSDIEPHA